ncbi:MAG TPA: FliM/FliN family flagellar motor switch protein [Noviherbaspirillum sp.]|nr:FliM/FliN family flagellar motor switch protein [Noviherbaspirillum sp.]
MPESETIAALHPELVLPAVLARKSVSPSYAELSRMIGRGRHLALSLAGDRVTLALHLEEDAQEDWFGAMMLSGPAGTLALAQGARMLRALTGIDPGDDMSANDERWAWMQAALVGRLAGTPFGFADRIQRLPGKDADSDCTLRLTLKTPHHAITTHARACIALWRHVLASAAWEKDLLPVHTCLDMSYASDIRIAQHELPASALRAIAAGDIILPSNPVFGCDGEGRVLLAGLQTCVRYRAPCSLEIIATEGNIDTMDTEYTTSDVLPGEIGAAADTSSAPSELDAIPVTLDFSLGQVKMRLGEMRALGPGTILSLSGGSPSSIAIRSADRLIGRGEVVDVNGQLGIRIVEWGAGE